MLNIETAAFTGPMDLLLDLVKESKLNIYEIEISSITERFLQVMQEVDIEAEELSDFIRMASLLVLMKASSLIKDSNEEDIPDKEELIRRLIEYQRCKGLVSWLNEEYEEGLKIFRKLAEDPDAYRESEEVEITGNSHDLHKIILELVQRKNDKKEVKFQYKKIMNIEEYPMELVANKIKDKLIKGEHFTFKDLLSVLPMSRPATIASFLTLLELSKNKMVSIEQKDGEREIKIRVLNKKALSSDANMENTGGENVR